MSDPSEINMEIDLRCSSEPWDGFAAIARSQQFKEAKNYLQNLIMDTHTGIDYENEKDERLFYLPAMADCERGRKMTTRRDMLMFLMRRVFQHHQRFEKICKDFRNNFISSGFTTYVYRNTQDEDECTHPVRELHEESNDLKYITDLCGFKLTYLDAQEHCYSQVMPLINNSCPNLKQLRLQFHEINSDDFENAFSNMPHLKGLLIAWRCQYSPIPSTLVRSLEQVGGTLTYLFLRNDIFLPDLSALAFPRLIALKELIISGFGLHQSLIQSIGEMKSLVMLRLVPGSLDPCSMIDEDINMYPIGNLKNLKTLQIFSDRGVTDEFLINLCNNAEQLQDLFIICTNITDNGIIALNKLQQLNHFSLGLTSYLEESNRTENKLITDKSISCLRNEKLHTLNLSNCIELTNRSVIKIIENLPNLEWLWIPKTKVSFEILEEIPKSTEYRTKPLFVYTSLEDSTGIFELPKQPFNIHFLS